MNNKLIIPRYYSELVNNAGGLARFGPVKLDSMSRVVIVQIGCLVFTVLSVILSGVANGRLWTYLVAVAVGIIMPLKELICAAKRKQRIIIDELPGLMEIAAMIMETGMSFDAAIQYITDHKKGYVADMFRRARNEINAGVKRETAYGRISQAGSYELSMFLDLVIKAEAQGRPVKDIVLELSRSFRDRQKNVIEEAANRLPTTMLIPIFVCIIPPMIFVYLLPALQNLGVIFR